MQDIARERSLEIDQAGFEMLVALEGLDKAMVDDIVLGCAMPEGEQGMNVSRIALLRAGLPYTVTGQTINRFCSSGLQSIALAAQAIRAGDAQCILAGGFESMSNIPYALPKARDGYRLGNGELVDLLPRETTGRGQVVGRP